MTEEGSTASDGCGEQSETARGDMRLHSHYADHHERTEIRVSMLSDRYEMLSDRADELGVDPVEYVEDLLDMAAEAEPGPGWSTGVELKFEEPARDL